MCYLLCFTGFAPCAVVCRPVGARYPLMPSHLHLRPHQGMSLHAGYVCPHLVGALTPSLSHGAREPLPSRFRQFFIMNRGGSWSSLAHRERDRVRALLEFGEDNIMGSSKPLFLTGHK